MDRAINGPVCARRWRLPLVLSLSRVRPDMAFFMSPTFLLLNVTCRLFCEVMRLILIFLRPSGDGGASEGQGARSRVRVRRWRGGGEAEVQKVRGRVSARADRGTRKHARDDRAPTRTPGRLPTAPRACCSPVLRSSLSSVCVGADIRLLPSSRSERTRSPWRVGARGGWLGRTLRAGVVRRSTCVTLTVDASAWAQQDCCRREAHAREWGTRWP